MNFSKVVTLPKAFTDNWLDESMIVQMSMSPEGRLTLTPVRGETSAHKSERNDRNSSNNDTDGNHGVRGGKAEGA